MLLTLHIFGGAITLAALIGAVVMTQRSPSKQNRFRISLPWLAGLQIITGALLILFTVASVVRVCVSSVVYLSLIGLYEYWASRKYARILVTRN